jgi:hypothetical protein
MNQESTNKESRSKLLLYIKIIGVSMITAVLIIRLLPKSEHICDAVDYFVGSLNRGLPGLFFLIKAGIAVILWTLGTLFWSHTRISKRINIYLYFFLVSVFSMSGIIHSALNSPQNTIPEVAVNICNKATGDFQELSFVNLTVEEYNYLNSRDKWMPSIPTVADSLNIEYYHDSFIGDFDLTIDFVLPKGMSLDTLEFSKWTKAGGVYKFNDFKM